MAAISEKLQTVTKLEKPAVRQGFRRHEENEKGRPRKAALPVFVLRNDPRAIT